MFIIALKGGIMGPEQSLEPFHPCSFHGRRSRRMGAALASSS